MVTLSSQGDWLTAGELLVQEDAREAVATGFKAVDALLPAGGIRRGSLIEWLAGGDALDSRGDVAGGAGAVSLAIAIACHLAKSGSRTAAHIAGGRTAARSGSHVHRKTILVIDRGGWFHPPAVMPWLDDARQLVVARPSHDDDEIWAIDQALRCRGVAAVVAWPRGMSMGFGNGRRGVPGDHGDRGERGEDGRRRQASRLPSSWTTAMRRWQLAARSSGGIGLFVRPATAIREPSWAEARFAVSPLIRAPSLLKAPSLLSNTLTQRRLTIERVGGAWNGGLTGKVTETVLDLARGCEGAIAHAHPFTISLAQPRHRHAATGKVHDTLAQHAHGGVACRAS